MKITWINIFYYRHIYLPFRKSERSSGDINASPIFHSVPFSATISSNKVGDSVFNSPGLPKLYTINT